MGWSFEVGNDEEKGLGAPTGAVGGAPGFSSVSTMALWDGRRPVYRERNRQLLP